jgi:NAD(P) transhydrogenase
MGDTGGMLKLLFDAQSLNLLGVHIAGTNACELIHTGQAYLRLGATAEQIANAIFNYPTLSDLYRHAAFEALAVSLRRQAGSHETSLDEYLSMKHLK